MRINDASPVVLITIPSLQHLSTHSCLSSLFLLSLMAAASPLPPNKLNYELACQAAQQVKKSFLEHVVSSKKQPLHSATVISEVLNLSRPCNYPLLPISSLLSTVIRWVSIRTSVYSRSPPKPPYLPSHILQYNEEHSNSSRIARTSSTTRCRDTCDMAVTVG